ncbi:hypothetical protein ILUMI_04311 [Ignelater luminosus]|uniref:Glutathione S-transferase theta-1 n=1 Tax=Ignelater luminosus TaxID=2038154 RepID=A0A8K0DK07_IGNLU|nr:hypothetical protein ILUMI_04311 [Ignelater luminosus]
MALKLYYDELSQPSRALLIILKISKIPFETCPVKLREGEHLSEEYKNEVSRFQKVPVIKDGDFTLTESIAILRYLSREKQISDQWYPKNSKAQARVDEYLEWQHNNVRLLCSLYLRVKWIEPRFFGKEASPKKIAPYESRMANCLDLFEELWLSKTPYIAGDQISAADIWAACEIEQPRLAGYDPEVGRPILSKWLNKIRKIPYYEEVHSRFNKMVGLEASGTQVKAKL